ncbi:hypothetical protein GGX14DRAFT_678956 [Mycena pura]|uniref:Uncharacterized protein n=1 Tax=Mycena pura TaxID=153505 RepID=A0AAD6UTC7_9AGAR|nr:hypothetical protein GGX14DRAFT_678956 [Mycena pura]
MTPPNPLPTIEITASSPVAECPPSPPGSFIDAMPATTVHTQCDDSWEEYLYPEPPSPGGSLRGLYVRSRPTSTQDSIIDFPFQHDLLATLSALGPTSSPAVPVFGRDFNFPPPPAVPPPASASAPPKTPRHAHSVRSLYTLYSGRGGTAPSGSVAHGGSGGGGRARHDIASADDNERDSRMPPPAKKSRRGWSDLRKLVPGLFHRPKGTATQILNADLAPLPAAADRDYVDMPPGHLPTTTDPEPAAAGHGDPGHTVAASSTTARRRRALSIKSFRAAAKGKKGKATAPRARDENVPPLPLAVRARVYSFTGFVPDRDDDRDDDDVKQEQRSELPDVEVGVAM